MKQTLNPVIELPKNCSGYVFKILNEDEYNDMFCIKTEPYMVYTESGEKLANEIRTIMINAKQTGRIEMTIAPTYDDDKCVVFRFEQMEQDEFGAIILYYEYINTCS